MEFRARVVAKGVNILVGHKRVVSTALMSSGSCVSDCVIYPISENYFPRLDL